MRRWAALSGVVGVALEVALILVGGSTPDTSTSGAAVQTFYSAHGSSQQAAIYLLAFSFTFLLFFFGVLGDHIQRHGGGVGSVGVMLAGMAVLVAGGTVGAGLTSALVDPNAHLSADGAKLLNVLASDTDIGTAVGALVTMVAAGLAVARGVGLPKWLGWVAVVDGLGFALSGVLGGNFPPLVLFLAWILVVSVLLLREQWSEASGAAKVSTAAQ